MSELKPIVVYGAGGLAREVKFILQRINAVHPIWDFRGYVVTDRTKLGEYDSADEIVGDEAWLLEQKGMSVALGIGTPRHRVAIGQRLSERMPDSAFPVLVDPAAIYDARTTVLEPGVILTANMVMTVHCRVKRFALINLCTTIGHEATIGRGCVINPSCNISGGVVLGDGVLVGTGAQVLQYLTVGEGATVGAGAVVTTNVEPGVTVVGAPAKPLAARA